MSAVSAAGPSSVPFVLKEPLWLVRVLAIVLLLNLADGVITLVLVTLSLATEANPIMAAALELGPVAFMVLKLGLVSAGVFVLWRHRTRRSAAVGSVLVLFVYLGIMTIHLESLRVLARYLA